MRAVLSPQVQNWAQTDRDEIMSLRGPSLKILNTAADVDAVSFWLDRNPGSSLLIRHVWGNPDDERRIATGNKDGAREALNLILRTFEACVRAAWQRGRIVYVEPSNEVIEPWSVFPKMSDFYAYFAEQCELVSKEGQLLPLAYSFAAGNPPGYGSADDPNHFNPEYATRADSIGAFLKHGERGFEACRWRVAMHPYGAPDMWTEAPYLIDRKELIQAGSVKVFGAQRASLMRYWYTETGIDGGVYSGRKDKAPGWRGQLDNHANPEAEYARQLRAAAVIWGRDPHVVAAYPFLHGANGDWQATGFDMDRCPNITRMWVSQFNASTGATSEGTMDYQEIKIAFQPGIAVLGSEWRANVSATMNGKPSVDGSLNLSFDLPRRDGGFLITNAQINDKKIYALDAQGSAVISFLIPDDALAPGAGGSLDVSATVVDLARDEQGAIVAGFGQGSVSVPIERTVPGSNPAGPSPIQPGASPEPFVPLTETAILPPAGSGYHRLFAIAGLQSQYADKIKELTVEAHLEIDRVKAKEAAGNPTATR